MEPNQELNIARVNNVSIVCVNKDETNYVPIRPICDALGIDANGQKQRIERDEILSSTACMTHAVAADEKEREMLSLPLKYIFGWLFSIDTSKVNEDAKPSVLRYKMECYNALYEYFSEPQTFLAQKQQEMEKYINEFQERQAAFKDAKKLMDESKQKLNAVTKLTIDEWRANNRQLAIDFKG